jgi:hypothetical protein
MRLLRPLYLLRKRTCAAFSGGEARWHAHDTPRFIIIDGEPVSGPVMRRYADGAWQYRQMTDQEEDEFRAHLMM